MYTRKYVKDIIEKQSVAFQFGGELIEFSNENNMNLIIDIVMSKSFVEVAKCDAGICDWDLAKWSKETEKLILFDYDMMLCIPKSCWRVC